MEQQELELEPDLREPYKANVHVIEKLVFERAELHAKCLRLRAMLKSPKSDNWPSDLFAASSKQLKQMENYVGTLKERITIMERML